MGTLAQFLLAALTIVTGRLTDTAGLPVGGARIDLLPQSVGWPGEPRKAGVSAQDGTFRFEPPVAREESPGWFHLRAESDRGIAITGAFPLGAGEVPLGDVTLLPAVVLRVEIRDWTGRPVSRVPVLAEVRGLGEGEGIDRPFALPLAAKTDGAGAASFSPLPADPGLRVVLRVDVQGNPVLERELTLPPSRNPVRITLGRGRTVRGRVLLSTGEPAANHNVEVGSRGALTDAGGGFSLGDLPCGGTVLLVETGPRGRLLPFRKDWRLKVPVPAGEPGGSTNLGDLRLPETVPPLHGRVVGDSGEPIAGANVCASLPAEVTEDVAAFCFTGGDGCFVLRGLPRWPVSVEARRPDPAGELRARVALLDTSAGGDGLVLHLTARGTVLLRFVERHGSDRAVVLRGIRVFVDGEPVEGPWASDRVRIAAPPGRHRVRVTAEGRRPREIEGVEFAPDRETRMDCFLLSR